MTIKRLLAMLTLLGALGVVSAAPAAADGRCKLFFNDDGSVSIVC